MCPPNRNAENKRCSKGSNPHKRHSSMPGNISACNIETYIIRGEKSVVTFGELKGPVAHSALPVNAW